MVDGVLELAWVAAVVLRSDNDEHRAGRDEATPLLDFGRLVGVGVVELGGQRAAEGDWAEGMGWLGRVDGDYLERLGCIGGVEASLEQSCNPRGNAAVVAIGSGAAQEQTEAGDWRLHVAECECYLRGEVRIGRYRRGELYTTGVPEGEAR